MSEMTLERAAKILNNYRYQLDSDSRFFWVVDSVSKSVFRMINNSSGYVVELDAFEAIAIAEKLERDAAPKQCGGTMPPLEIKICTPIHEAFALGECINIIDCLPDAKYMRLVVEWLSKKYPESS